MTEEFLSGLEQMAKRASENSYSPYSKFPVGAALRTKDGSIFTGCNVENASYGLTICAERAAIFHAVATIGPGFEIEEIAIYCDANTAVGPCGACRQVIYEFGPNADVTYGGYGGEQTTIKNLLPDAFGPEDL